MEDLHGVKRHGCKLYYYGEDGRRNGVGIILRKDLTKSVLEVRRV